MGENLVDDGLGGWNGSGPVGGPKQGRRCKTVCSGRVIERPFRDP